MVKQYRKKPVVIEAIQWNGNTNYDDVEKFIGSKINTEIDSETAYVAGKGLPTFSLLIETKEGIMKAFKGDYIIKEPFPTGDRDFYPCKPDIFKSTYEVVENPVAKTEKPLFGIGVDPRYRNWASPDEN